jgi:hypothetical protein
MIATHSRAVKDAQMAGWDWRRTSAADVSAPDGDVMEVTRLTHRLHTHTHTVIPANLCRLIGQCSDSGRIHNATPSPDKKNMTRFSRTATCNDSPNAERAPYLRDSGGVVDLRSRGRENTSNEFGLLLWDIQTMVMSPPCTAGF